ncbi:hypothetical protein [Methylobacterium sp. Leaf118]|uniref:hypothetical protein n=1 Tax=Methylobacterium sp. Leaf118 TaxID=2876562 RepID=UPI001E459A1B|nr:hypothetical protein [Methylobacterium sp. Leaf118]
MTCRVSAPTASLLTAVAVALGSPVPLRAEPVAVRVASSVEGVEVAALASVPKAPPEIGETALCARFIVAPKSPAGRRVTEAGWAVTGEARLGRFQAVSFAGRFTQGTSGSCEIGNGNVGIFEGQSLRAVAYARKGATRSIGRLVPFGDGLRLWDGGFLPQPLADLRLDAVGGGVSVVPLAPIEAICGGKGLVPNVYGQPITRAREWLRQAGWRPVTGPAPEDPRSREGDLVRMGVAEVESCSGTGFGFCAYGYAREGVALSVTTVGDGDDPSVSGYVVDCRS